LGDEGRELIAREWVAAKEPLTKRFLLYVAHSLAWRIEPILAEATTAMSKPAKEMPAWHVQVPNNSSLYRCLPEYLVRMDVASDPAMAERMLKAYPKEWSFYPTFAKHLKPETLLAWIEPIAMESAHPSNRPRILSAWKAVGAAAIPSMERVRTAMLAKGEADKVAAEYAKAIEESIREMK
jgi:hypothetical protein